MEIKDFAYTKAQKATIFNQLTEGAHEWGSDEFENDEPDIRVTLADSERIALLTGVMAHDYLNPYEARLIGTPLVTKMNLLLGQGESKEVTLRMAEPEEHELLEAAAWTARHVHEIEAYAPVESTIERDVDGEQGVTHFREAMPVLARMVMELEEASLILPEQPNI